jgi:hypothetical protein
MEKLENNAPRSAAEGHCERGPRGESSTATVSNPPQTAPPLAQAHSSRSSTVKHTTRARDCMRMCADRVAHSGGGKFESAPPLLSAHRRRGGCQWADGGGRRPDTARLLFTSCVWMCRRSVGTTGPPLCAAETVRLTPRLCRCCWGELGTAAHCECRRRSSGGRTEVSVPLDRRTRETHMWIVCARAAGRCTVCVDSNAG